MFLPPNSTVLTDPKLNPGDASLLGKTISTSIPRDWPIEYILIRLFFVTTGTALTLFPATAQTPDNYDNILNILKHITLSIAPGSGLPNRTVVDCDGVRLLEYNQKTGVNLDASTLNMIQLSQGSTVAASTAYSITYLVPMAELCVAEPLRSRLLLPVHKYQSDPKLQLQFQTLANMASAGGIATLGVDIELVRRTVTAASEAILAKTQTTNPWGYLDWDLIEQDFPVAAVANTEQKFDLALGASYINYLVSQYRGGTNVTRNVVDNIGIGDTVANGLGNEDLWRTETSLVVDRQWRWRDLLVRNQMSQAQNNITQASSPSFSGPILAGTNFQAASSVFQDLLRDGIDGDSGNELGSVLNCNLSQSQKKQLIGKCAAVATNPSQICVMGRRFFGDLSPWQNLS